MNCKFKHLKYSINIKFIFILEKLESENCRFNDFKSFITSL